MLFVLIYLAPSRTLLFFYAFRKYVKIVINCLHQEQINMSVVVHNVYTINVTLLLFHNPLLLLQNILHNYKYLYHDRNVHIILLVLHNDGSEESKQEKY